MRIKKEGNFPPEDALKRLKNSKLLLVGAVALFMVFAVLSVDALRRPQKIEEKVVSNKIVQKTNFDYKIEVKPCILYPDGGIVSPEGDIISEITKSIKLTVNSDITSEKPVTVKGTQKVTFSLIAENLWERQYVLTQEKPFEMNGMENKIIQSEYVINLQELYDFMEKVQKEIKAYPEKYLIKLKPQLNGNIIFEDKEIPLDTTPEITFEAGSNFIKLLDSEENQESEKKTNGREFIKETPVENINTIYPEYNLFGRNFPIIAVRYGFSITALLLLLFIIYSLKQKIKLPEGKVLSEAEKIDKKYKSRLLFLQGAINKKDKSVFTLQTFKSLINLSDERELPIVRIKNDDMTVSYQVVDGDCIYVYEASNAPVHMSVPRMKMFFLLGK